MQESLVKEALTEQALEYARIIIHGTMKALGLRIRGMERVTNVLVTEMFTWVIMKKGK